MGALFDMSAFYRWLAGASEIELLAKRDQLASVLLDLSEAEVISEAKKLLKNIEQEMLARRLRP
jgi:hypothetical protein